MGEKLDATKRAAIGEVVRGADFSRFPEWAKIDELAEAADIDGVEVFEDEVLGDEREFSGLANLYLTLRFDGDTEGAAFPTVFKGHFEQGRPVIDSLQVDTSSLY